MTLLQMNETFKQLGLGRFTFRNGCSICTPKGMLAAGSEICLAFRPHYLHVPWPTFHHSANPIYPIIFLFRPFSTSLSLPISRSPTEPYLSLNQGLIILTCSDAQNVQ